MNHQRASTVAPNVFRSWFSSYPSHELVGLPALSPTMETGTIASWNMKEGDSFGPGDVICSVETDKATVDFEAQDDGIIAKILAPAGSDELTVGAPIMITVEEEEDASAFKNYVLKESEIETSAPDATIEPPAIPVAQASAPGTVPTAPSTVPTAVRSVGDKVIASPLAHMISKEFGYDISSILGTGPDGRIIAADVREFVPDAVAAPALGESVTETMSPIIGAEFTDYPISESAKELANRLAQSKRNVPHYYLTVDICMDNVLKLRKELSNEVEEGEIGVFELVIKAAAKSMKVVPAANASWTESAVRVYDSVDINVVVGTGDNLYAPMIRDCGAKGIKSISDELSTAVSAVENCEIPADFASVGTFTIMNLGMYGIKSCAPIIREPQACALALGALENRIVPNDETDCEDFYKESVVMTATMSLDHRVIDGAAGAPWLSAFKSHLENPTTLLL